MDYKVYLDKLYAATRNGLDIICDNVAITEQALSNPQKAFRLRASERTPSAHLYPPDDRKPYWHIVDYGRAEQMVMSPIDTYMWTKGYQQADFSVAVHELMQTYSISETINPNKNNPDCIVRKASETETDGSTFYEKRDSFTAKEIKMWGPNVKEEHLRSLGWSPCEHIATVKNGEVKECHSNENYPIFVQECKYINTEGIDRTFSKVYQPMGSIRFRYIGTPPKDYIFGLDLVKREVRKNNDEKLSAIAIVSGGSDAVNCLSMGLVPVYFNSETAFVGPETINKLHNYAKCIYYIPDIDETGRKVGKAMALRYLDLKTIWLPEHKMDRIKDKHGNKRKDLKDFLELYPSRAEFENLKKNAKRARFWDYKKKKDSMDIEIVPSYFLYFLELNGFFTYEEPDTKELQIIRIQGKIVEKVTVSQISQFVRDWIEEFSPSRDVLDAILVYKEFPAKLVNSMRTVKPNFNSATADSQCMFFKNCWIKVTAEGIKQFKYSELGNDDCYIWKDKIINHDYKEMPPMFYITCSARGQYGITVNNGIDCEFFRYLRNTSRLYWREEDEQGLQLTEEQLMKQEMNLVAKIAAIGYYLYRYKDEANAYACILVDNKMKQTNDIAEGRSGKSFLARTLKVFLSDFELKGNKDLPRTNFLFDGVTRTTDFLCIDECKKDFPYNFFFGFITDSMNIEGKHKHQYSLEFHDSPKFMYITNFGLPIFDASTMGRIWILPFSDYYHQMAHTNDYKENRSIRDDFGHLLLDRTYPEQQWITFIAFMMQCLQFYLSLPANAKRIHAPLDNVVKKAIREEIGQTEIEWFDDYFCENSDHLDVELDYDTVFNTYIYDTRSKLTKNEFTKRMKLWVEQAEHIYCYNPADITGNKTDGERYRKYSRELCKKVPYIYIRSQKAADEIARRNSVSTTEGTLDYTYEDDVPF